MAKTWSITGPAKTEVKNGAPAEIMFSITNILAEPVSGLVRILPQAPLTPSCFKLPPDNNLSFAANETKAYTFKFDPTGLDANTYMYEVTVAPPANPNDPMADRITSSAEVMQKKKPPKWWLYAVIAGVLILAGVGAYFLLGGGIEIPDVAGSSVKDATVKLNAEGFKNVATEAKESEEPNGQVLGTDPSIGSKEKADEPITLLVSTGPAIPPLTGSDEATALTTLQERGFEVSDPILRQADEVVASGVVIGTIPEAGKRAKIGELVKLLVSTGPQTPDDVIIEPVKGLTPQAAKSILETQGFVVEFDCIVVPGSDGTVVVQSPDGGEPAPRGSTVNVVFKHPTCIFHVLDPNIVLPPIAQILDPDEEIPEIDFGDLPDFGFGFP
jgi:beta-lactam-binding protein with PASTA domain